MGQRFPTIIYVSLIPICFGVILASGADVNVSAAGLCAAITSALAQTFMNISIKSVREKTGYSGQKSFLGMTIVATFATLPVVAASSYSTKGSNGSTFALFMSVFTRLSAGDSWPLLLTLLAAMAYHVEYVLNFTFVSYVSSVTFSVCDIARRIAIILTGAFLFKNIFKAQKWVVILIDLSGVLWYSYLDNTTKKIGADKAASAAPDSKTVPNEPEKVPNDLARVSGSAARARNHKNVQK
jgi:drug/metabolite transporter (DMT)-like permease